MTVSSGFYSSINHDRLYSNYDFSNLFNGLVSTGVYENVGTAFTIRPDGGRKIIIGPGSAWLDGYWLNNDSNYQITFNDEDINSNKYIVLEINLHNRTGSIKAVDECVNKYDVKQYQIGIVKVTNNISISDITRTIGKGQPTPYTSLLVGSSEPIPIQEIQNLF